MTTTTTALSSSSVQNNNLQMVDNDAPFANIADPPTDVDFLGELTYTECRSLVQWVLVTLDFNFPYSIILFAWAGWQL